MDAKRDWGHAKDFVEGMWLILQHDKPDDFVLATGETHTVREFIELTCKEVGIEIEWHGAGKDEKGTNKKTGDIIVEVDSRYYRPTEVDILLGNPEKAKKELGWESKYSFNELISEMVKSDMLEAEKEKSLRDNGYRVMDYHE